MKLFAILVSSFIAGSVFAAGSGDVVLGPDNNIPAEISHPNCVIYITQSSSSGLVDHEIALMESLSKKGYSTRGVDGSFNSAMGDETYKVFGRGQMLAWVATSFGDDGHGGGEALYTLHLKASLMRSEANISASIQSDNIEADKHHAYEVIADLLPKCVTQTQQ